jgi:hypothetical protein
MAMAGMVRSEDLLAISDLIARYCWHVDQGNADEWVTLWTSDGTFIGAGPEPVVGRDALKGVVEHVVRSKMRHQYGNLHCDYLDDEDTVRARYYNQISQWQDGGSLMCIALTELILVRTPDGWRIKLNTSSVVE